MKVAIGSDHGGYLLKEAVKAFLSESGYDPIDFGCNSTDRVDYPDYGFPVAEAVAAGRAERGILVCTTGIGMCIVANKVRGIRCALCCDVYAAELTRMHNDTNVLALGAHGTEPELARKIVSVWLTTGFTGGRHSGRIAAVSDYENSHIAGGSTCQTS